MANLLKTKKKAQNANLINSLPLVKYVYVTAGVNIFLIASVLVLNNKLPPVVPLFYGLAQGEDQLVVRILLVLPSLVSLAFLLINTAVAYFLKDDYFKKVMVLTPLGATLFSALTTVKIILLVGYF